MDGAVALVTGWGAILIIALLALAGESFVSRTTGAKEQYPRFVSFVRCVLIFICGFSAVLIIGAIIKVISITPVVFLW